ncbi:unnamed protein product [Microthlaspi erraticum]|uniref:Uncharacterized protein n=1 Tax=Microthlaspi erraticum TaxID=1685480 RepID=A0A6D2HZD3_9BRAS|nr:unnamed protein product [Microthlaspi erraticum]
MAGTDVSGIPTFKLKLLVDKEKNKVVLAEAGMDFVDVFRSFLALPMATIVRLLEKYEPDLKPRIGCFNNLYESVSDLPVDDFMREACKGMLLYPEKQCRQLHLNLDDDTECTDDIFNLNTECDKISVIVTENMQVQVASTLLIVNILNGLGYKNHDMLEKRSVDVDHKEALSLLHCLLYSETPLTDVFLKKLSSCGIPRLPDMPTLTPVQGRGMAEPKQVVSLTVLVRKQDKKVIYAESGPEFVDLLFLFLAIPLESVWDITRSNTKLGCVDNFCTSMKSLFSSGNVVSTCMLPPLEYSFRKSLLGVPYKMNNFSESPYYKYIVTESYEAEETWECDDLSGFVKRCARYMISDDLTITAAHSFSTISFVMELNVDFDDMESYTINISKTQINNSESV